VVLDSKVIIDLKSSEAFDRHDGQESLGLAAERLDDLISATKRHRFS